MSAPLHDQVEELLRQQVEEWPLLGRGVAGLREALTRPVLVDGDEVLVRHMPHRVASTTAAVDRESIRKRPCFLCPENLDPAEKGVPFGGDFTVYANPFPVVERHLTVVNREHRPQRVEGQVGAILDLAAGLPGSFVVYNGPNAGASAPDHMHLQAGSRTGVPVFARAARAAGPAFESHGVRALLLRGADRSRLLGETERALALLAEVTGKSPEPWVNVAAFLEPTGWTLLLFPRAKHRPDAYHRGELTVSPAALDMCGVLVVPYPADFEKITAADVAAIYREVTLPAEQLREVVARLERES